MHALVGENARSRGNLPYLDAPIGRVSAGTLDSGFIGFGATVAEECLFSMAIFTQPVGQGSLFGDVV